MHRKIHNAPIPLAGGLAVLTGLLVPLLVAGAVILSRDHVTETLANTIPSATQPVGRPDVSGRGLFDNLAFWNTMEDNGRVLRG